MSLHEAHSKQWRDQSPMTVAVAEAILDILAAEEENAELRAHTHLKWTNSSNIPIIVTTRKKKLADCEPFESGHGTYLHVYPLEYGDVWVRTWVDRIEEKGLNGSWQPSRSRFRISLTTPSEVRHHHVFLRALLRALRVD